MAVMYSTMHGGGGGGGGGGGRGGGAVGHPGEEPSPSSACAVCGENEQGSSDGATTEEELFALRCNSCRRWYHPWCMGYQLDLDRSCLVTASEVDIPIDPASGIPLVCQWFCDSCASTVTGVVATTAARRQRQSAAGSNRKAPKHGNRDTNGRPNIV